VDPAPAPPSASPAPDAETSAPSAPRPDAHRDTLTGLANRKTLITTIGERLSRLADGSGSSGPALITLRLSEYRDVTESFGHQAGQELLTAAATRLSEVPPHTATVARIAEDTFAVFLPQADEAHAQSMGEDLMDCFSAPFSIDGHPVPIEASLGLAADPVSGVSFGDAEEMLRASYSAMHQVQRQGGGTLHVYQDDEEDETRWLQRRERLRQAIQEDELQLHYQPIVHLVSGTPVGAEALVRWNHPDRGLLSPAAFIPLAEETSLVGELDRWVFNQALADASRWTQTDDGLLDWVSVNISPQSVEGDLQRWCLDQLSGATLPPGGLHLEITERCALRDERSLQPLRDEGVHLSIDDFGTGYSSLRYLRSLEADVLKIDSEFVQDLGKDEKTTAIVQFLMNLSLRLDVEVIAEGVETPEQETILRELGCAMAQGYHFGRPMPADTLVKQLTSTVASSEDADDEVMPAA
jgi:diguanylate cyclase (GGDEF)-like protein